MNKKFELGQIVFTPAALAAVDMGVMLQLIGRHAAGDWSQMSAHDRRVNEQAVIHGDRVLSSYTVEPNGRPEDVWVITEWDRSVTTVLLPSDN